MWKWFLIQWRRQEQPPWACIEHSDFTRWNWSAKRVPVTCILRQITSSPPAATKFGVPALPASAATGVVHAAIVSKRANAEILFQT
jgi:hypothetical protein